MRLLHVVDSRQLRGAEMFAADLIRELARGDISQCVAVIRDTRDTAIQFAAPSKVLGSNGRGVSGLRTHLQTFRALRKMIGAWQPDVIQAHGGNSFKYTVPASMGRQTPIVYRKIGPTPKDVIGALKRAGHGQLMRRAARVVAVGEAVRQEVVDGFRVPAGRVTAIPNAVDPDRMQTQTNPEVTRRDLGIPVDVPVILSLGALTWEKDPLSHVEIGARVLRALPNAIHVMVGDGPLRSEVEAAIRHRRLDKRLWLLPARADAPELMAISDVLLLASRTEGIPGCVIEAGMLGVPTAAYAVGGVPEIVVEGVTGRLARAGDVAGLAGCLLELLHDPGASRLMGEAARERYRGKFDIRLIAPRYLELYDELGVP